MSKEKGETKPKKMDNDEEAELVDSITLVDEETGQEKEFYVLEGTRINGKDYILVADTLDEDAEAEAMILVDTSKAEDKEAIYNVVEDEEELNSLSKIFSELMDDTCIELSMDE